MKRLYLLLTAVLVIAGAAAQGRHPVCLTDADAIRAELAAGPARYGGIHCAYSEPDAAVAETPVPRGYRPFYVSHYGRHGSRYLVSDAQYVRVLDTLAAHADALTPFGRDILGRLQALRDEVAGHAGQLSPLGEAQHRGIGRRLRERLPEVFSGGRVVARASTYPRCIASMNAFCEGLHEADTSLVIEADSRPEYMEFIAYNSPELKEWRKAVSRRRKPSLPTQRLIDTLFADRAAVASPVFVTKALFRIAVGQQNIPSEIRFDDLFTGDELFALWRAENAGMYLENGDSSEGGGTAPASARSLLRDFVSTTDADLASGEVAASLRFGHDVYLLRLLALAGVEGCAERVGESDSWLVWQDYRLTPMAANLQMVFYRNRRGAVLVKLLLNEREVWLPLAARHAPYYEWPALREYLCDRAKE